MANFRKFRHLNMPETWEQYWSKYPNGYTILESLIDWVSQVDNMTDNVNDWNEYLVTFVETFDTNLQIKVKTILNDWQTTGFLDVVVSEALEWELDNYKDEANQRFSQNESDIGNLQNTTMETQTNLISITRLISPEMTTAEIQTELDKQGNFKFLGGTYYLDFNTEDFVCLDIRSNTHIEMEAEVRLVAPVNGLDTYNILRLNRVENVTIIGNKSILQGDRHLHTGSTGEWGHGVAVRGAKNVHIQGLISRDCWGDGFYVAGYMERDNEIFENSENVVVTECIGDNNRRQGISVTASINGRYFNNVFKNTNGTAPEAGMDLEPDREFKVENNVVENNVCENNNGDGIHLVDRFEGFLRTNKNKLLNNRLINNGKNGINVIASENILIDGNTAENNEGVGIRAGGVKKLIIVNNEALNNTGLGITMPEMNDSVVSNNVAIGNGNMGIAINNSHDNTISSNISYDNGYNGYGFLNAKQNNIFGNRSRNNVDSHMKFTNGSQYNLIRGNYLAVSEGELYGIEFENTASRNVIVDNYMRGCASSAGIRDNGESNRIGMNLMNSGYYTDEIS